MMSRREFRPKMDVQDYLDSGLNNQIYNALTKSTSWRGVFEPIDFFNQLYFRYHILESQSNRPLDAVKELSELSLTNVQLFFLLDCLLWLIYNEYASSNIITDPYYSTHNYRTIGWQEKDRVHRTIAEGYGRVAELYGMPNTKWMLAMFTIIEDKQTIVHQKLIEEGFFKKNAPTLPSVEDMETIESDEQEETAENNLNQLVLSKKGDKIELIRLLYALHQLNLIKTTDNGQPTKKQFMISFGKLLGEDFSGYAGNLDQGFNVDQKTYMRIFDRLKKVAQEQWESSQEKGKK